MTTEVEWTVDAAERQRLVKLCAHLTGRPDTAEDLAQETLLEAWRHEQQLRDPDRRPEWLSGISRNVCRRWLRTQGRQHGQAWSDQIENTIQGGVDLELELERGELADLLDQAVALLPPETRAPLVARYLDEQPVSEIAQRLALQPGTLAVRLHRGRLALRRVLETELREQAGAYGLVSGEPDQFEITSIWCPLCGRQRLLGKLDATGDELILRCPGCALGADTAISRSLLPGVFRGIQGYRAAYKRAAKFLGDYNWRALQTGTANCKWCGCSVPVERTNWEHHPLWRQDEPGVYMRCPCGATNQSPLRYLVLGAEPVQRFWRDHPRLRTIPVQSVTRAHRPALLLRFESPADGWSLDVLCDSESYQIAETHTFTKR